VLEAFLSRAVSAAVVELVDVAAGHF